MPSTGGVVDSTIISMRPIDVIPTSRQLSAGTTTTTGPVPDDREIFKVNLLPFFFLHFYHIIKIFRYFLGIT